MTFSQHVLLRALTAAALYALFDVLAAGPLTRVVLNAFPTRPAPPAEPPDPVPAA